MEYAQVILPLPLPGSFTYSIPDDLTTPIFAGSRVLVQFGRKKFYTGVVESIHSDPPKGYEVKPIMMVLDEKPSIRYPQIKFWKWIADYYLCTPGEVIRAALPTGLKIESETYVALNEDFEEDSERPLSEREAMVLHALGHFGPMKILDIEAKGGVKNVSRVINRLFQIGAVEVNERMVEHYRARKIKMVRTNIARNDHDTLHSAFERVHRAQKQEKLLIAYLDLSRWMYASQPLKEVERDELLKVAGVQPPILKALVDKGILEVYTKEVNRFNAPCESFEPKLTPLTPAQLKAHDEIRNVLKTKDVALLRGVTGSGKTEIYTHLIASVLAQNDQVLYLVPEIALTTQLTDRLRKVFGDRLLVYHSRFSDSERVDIWNRLLNSTEPLVVLGARSAVFLPFNRLGLVVVDEEHESSYKQYDPAPRYNARDSAIMLAKLHGAKVLLGSATPSIETYYKALQGRFGLVELTERYGHVNLPEVMIVDMKDQRKRKKTVGILSEPLRNLTWQTLKAGNQSIMFQNRRGFAPMVVCKECGWTPKCVNCDVSMVYHKGLNVLKCHYCGYTAPLPNLCPACKLPGIEVFGYGTERIAEDLHKEFDGYRVARMDLDTTRNKDAYQEIIEEFATHQTDILVGTQMVSKGLDFGKVDVVGVLSADTLLNFPDFRCNERAFNMLEQVSGRAGRRSGEGKVVIQTTSPQNPILDFVRRHDYLGYYKTELADRQRYAYPPFTRVINIHLRHRERETVMHSAIAYAKALISVFGNRVLGPEEPVVARISNFHLQNIMLKVEVEASMTKVKAILQDIYERLCDNKQFRETQVFFDVDPA